MYIDILVNFVKEITVSQVYKYNTLVKHRICVFFLAGANGGDSLITVSSSELVSMQSPSSWSALANHHGGGGGGHHHMPPMNPTRISPQPALIPTSCMGGQMSPTSAAYYQPRQTHPPFYTWYWRGPFPAPNVWQFFIFSLPVSAHFRLLYRLPIVPTKKLSSFI